MGAKLGQLPDIKRWHYGNTGSIWKQKQTIWISGQSIKVGKKLLGRNAHKNTDSCQLLIYKSRTYLQKARHWHRCKHAKNIDRIIV